VNKVTTTSTCGRCGRTWVRVGMHGSDLPVGWAGLNLEREVTVDGHQGKPFVLFCDAICPPCQDAVLEMLKPGAKPARRFGVCRYCGGSQDCNCIIENTTEKGKEAPDADFNVADIGEQSW